jgi:regulator of chromosome condensation
MAPKKVAPKAKGAGTSISRANKKSAIAPVASKSKLIAKKTAKTEAKKKDATSKAATVAKATPASSTSGTKKLQKNSVASEPEAVTVGGSAVPGEIAPKASKAQKKEATVKTANTATTKGTQANISRKRSLSSIEEQAPVAPHTANKKTKMNPGNSKRKATSDTNKRARKVRKTEEPDDQEDEAVEPAKAKRKPAAKKAAAPAKRAATPKVPKVKKEPATKFPHGVQINFAPTQPLDIFVFGSGESGELGLGNKKVDGKKPVGVRRPRIHPLLPADKVGVVQIACGGMHSVALTKDNKILTWGVNDQGALGRDTAWDGGLRDADAEDDEDNDDSFESLNPIECTPTEVDTRNIADGTKFTKVVASDSASFALTEDGRVYGWGTFRVSF